MLLLAVKNELGVTVLPWAAAQDNLEPGRITLREIDHRLFVRELSLCWHEAGVQSNAVDKVRQTIVSLFAGFKETGGWSV
ncbi:LysR substrate binding domain protein [compost metagenome]